MFQTTSIRLDGPLKVRFLPSLFSGRKADPPFADLLPLMKRLENYQKPSNSPDLHGYDGPIAISNGGTINPLAQDFLRASDAIGIPYSGTSIALRTSWMECVNNAT
jgi:hypothetical protein